VRNRENRKEGRKRWRFRIGTALTAAGSGKGGDRRARPGIGSITRADGCGERKVTLRPGITTESHADDQLFYEDLKDTVMVGTSSGGMVVCRAAELRDRVGRIVLVDALALLNMRRSATS
jgi:pimeloyl-ACP methyl ester carboxylesterase